jgi:hypothetical protein
MNPSTERAQPQHPKIDSMGAPIHLADRLRMVDSCGHLPAINRVFGKIGLTPFNTLTEWAKRKDKELDRKRNYQAKKEIKIQRAKKRSNTLKNGYKAAKKAKTDGTDYGSGIALNVPTVAALHPSKRRIHGSKQKKKQTKPCRCGSWNHQNANARDCPYNKRNKAGVIGTVTPPIQAIQAPAQAASDAPEANNDAAARDTDTLDVVAAAVAATPAKESL